MNIDEIKKSTIDELFTTYPFLTDFFTNFGLEVDGQAGITVEGFFNDMDQDELDDLALEPEIFLRQMNELIEQMLSFIGEEKEVVSSVTILPGKDKSGQAETFKELTINIGEIICIVGPTGSGKSRLLGDIEWVAQQDTPTGRKILINNQLPDKKWRFSISDKLVAQLSQNMNFVMDLSVYDFIELHAESRMVKEKEKIIKRIIVQANLLTGEKFDPLTPITSLSGGQSRALMIADTAILSKSPIVLIDEIENAGIDRKEALKLLISEDKIVLMATHDPILALMGNKRLVIRNGGIHKIIETTKEERGVLAKLEKMDRQIMDFRTRLRQGEILN